MKYEYYGTNGSGFDWRIIALLIAGAILFFTHTCKSPRGTKTIIRTSIDTVYTSSKDTVWEEKVKYVNIEIPIPDTVYLLAEDTISSYKVGYSDSLLDAKFKIEVDGVLIDYNFNYIAKYPKYIHTRDTFRINTTTTLEENKRQLFLGLEVGGTDNSFNLSPTISLKGKNDFIYTYRYDLFTRAHNVGIQKLLKLK